MPLRKSSGFVLVVVAAGCGGATHWQLACGCVSTSAAIGQELGITTYLEDGSIDPNLIVTKLREKVNTSGLVATLEAVRAIGPAHNTKCYADSFDTVRCMYWFWNNDDGRRGLQVDIKARDFVVVGVEPVSYRYFEEAYE
jgi:hypothetical protein